MNNRNFADKPERQRKSHKFNIIDLLLIIIIIAAAAVLMFIMIGSNFFGESEETIITYTIEIPMIKNDFIETIKKVDETKGIKGQKILNSSRLTEMGEIQSIEFSPAIQNKSDLSDDGKVYERVHPDHSKVVITIKAKCKIEYAEKVAGREKVAARYFVNGDYVAVGVQMFFRTPYLVGYGNCTSVKIEPAKTDKEN